MHKKLVTIFTTLAVSALTVAAEPTAPAMPRAARVQNVTTNYGRLNGSAVEFAPRIINIGGLTNGYFRTKNVWTAHANERQYRAQNWLPIDWKAEVREGFSARFTGTFEAGTNDDIRAVFAYDPIPPPPPRNLQLSKMKLKANMRQIGIWSNVWEMVSSDPELLSDWNDSVVFDERNEFVQGAFAALESYGLTPELREFIVTNSVTEIEVRQ